MRIQKKTTSNPEISTASMPDIVFLLLFFFMVTATIKPKEEHLDIKEPQAKAITKVKKKFLVKELNVGFPKNRKLGDSPRISAAGKMVNLQDIGQWVQEQKADLGEAYKDQMIVLIRADEGVDMGIIGDLQLELRKHNARKVLFRTLEKS